MILVLDYTRKNIEQDVVTNVRTSSTHVYMYSTGYLYSTRRIMKIVAKSPCVQAGDRVIYTHGSGGGE